MSVERSVGEGALRRADPRERIACVVDPGSAGPIDAELEAPRRSAYLSRWSIRTQDDDGLATARGTLNGFEILVAAQDERFVGGSIGAGHAVALQHLFTAALRERPSAVVLLLASGGVRLHEANPAEVELARALSRLFDVRAAGTPVVALAVGDVFGGASVLACAADRVGMLPRARLGVSGPRVIAARDPQRPDERDDDPLDGVFDALSRSAGRQVDLVADETAAVRSWIVAAARAAPPFDESVATRHAVLGAASVATPRPSAALPEAWRARASPVAPGAPLWKLHDAPAWIVPSYAATPVGPAELHAVDDALLAQALPQSGARRTLILLEDSPGHEVSLLAETIGLSRYLAQHAAVLARLRHAGVRLVGLLEGTGHSAAFFTHALQAPRLYALTSARVMAMAPEGVARVTRLAPDELAPYLETDAALGHGMAAFAQSGALAGTFERLDEAALRALLD